MDIEPADLLERLKEGKIYRPNQAARAMDHFFTLKNLAALREIALRRTADRLNRAADTGVGTKAKSSEHILVCLSGAPSNANVIRTAARMAEAFRSSFTALFVETSDFKDMSDDNRSRLRANPAPWRRSWGPASPRCTATTPPSRSPSTPGPAA